MVKRHQQANMKANKMKWIWSGQQYIDVLKLPFFAGTLCGNILPQSPVQQFFFFFTEVLWGKTKENGKWCRTSGLPAFLYPSRASYTRCRVVSRVGATMSSLHLSFQPSQHQSTDAPVIDRQSNNTMSRNNFTHSILDLSERAVGLVKSYGFHIKIDFFLGDQLQWKHLS